MDHRRLLVVTRRRLKKRDFTAQCASLRRLDPSFRADIRNITSGGNRRCRQRVVIAHPVFRRAEGDRLSAHRAASPDRLRPDVRGGAPPSARTGRLALLRRANVGTGVFRARRLSRRACIGTGSAAAHAVAGRCDLETLRPPRSALFRSGADQRRLCGRRTHTDRRPFPASAADADPAARPCPAAA